MKVPFEYACLAMLLIGPLRVDAGEAPTINGHAIDPEIYSQLANENYRHLGVRHRRAVLFLKGRYWVVFDRLTPHGQALKAHEYWWRGHFQPMEITVDASTKSTASSVVDGKCLYVVPAHPEQLDLELGRGLIADGIHAAEQTLEGPYVSVNRKSDGPVSFTVL